MAMLNLHRIKNLLKKSFSHCITNLPKQLFNVLVAFLHFFKSLNHLANLPQLHSAMGTVLKEKKRLEKNYVKNITKIACVLCETLLKNKK